MVDYKKIYATHYAILLNKKNLVIWACGSDEWKVIYKPHPKLHQTINATWTL